MANVLINFGRTRSYIDRIRYITNNSSGKMGAALYEELIARNHHVISVVGDNDVNFKKFTYRVLSNDEMLIHMEKHFPWADIVISCAALNDFGPKEVVQHKISKRDSGELTLELVPLVDVLKTLGHKKTHQYLVGFSAQDNDNDFEYAKRKIKEKNLDLIIINNINKMGSNVNKITLMNKNFEVSDFPSDDKKMIAKKIIDYIESVYQD